MIIIDGKKVAADIRLELKLKVEKLKEKQLALLASKAAKVEQAMFDEIATQQFIRRKQAHL